MMKNPDSKDRKLKGDVFSRNPEDPDFSDHCGMKRYIAIKERLSQLHYFRYYFINCFFFWAILKGLLEYNLLVEVNYCTALASI